MRSDDNAEGKPENRKTEAALRESEERWSSTLASIGDAVIATDAAGNVIFMNKVAENLTGWTMIDAAHHPVKKIFRIINEFTRQEVEDPVAKVIAKNLIVGLANHTVLVRKDKTEIAIDDSGAPIRDKDDKIVGVVLIFRDITERRKAEAELKEREQLYRTVFENGQDGFQLIEVIHDRLGNPVDHKFLKINSAYEKIIGVKAEQILDKTARSISPACESYWFEIPDGVARTGKSEHAVLYNNDIGKYLDCYYFYYGKNIVGTLFRDVTEQKKAEEQIKEQASLLDNANEAILLVDLEHRITYWNKGAERIYGWTKEEAIGRKTHNLLKHNSAIVAEAEDKLLSAGEWIGELRHTTKDGRAITVESRWTVVPGDNKKPKSIMEINSDITERKKIEGQYLRAQRLESLGTLAGGIAHDLRNILTPITITLGLIDQNLSDKGDHEMIAALQKNLQRGADLIKQLLIFTRGVEGERVPLSLPSLIFDIEKTIKETFPRSINIETKADTSLPLIMGDSTQLHQVLINLCINARDAMPFGGALTITAEEVFLDQYYAKLHREAKTGSYVVISVEDNGVGMPPEVMERLFEPFFTTKKGGEGTGLGLSTARSIVKSHSGFINVYSEVGKGATFKIYLPTADLKGEQKEGIQDASLPKGNGETILIVDDEELIRITTTAALENNGYKALGASDGAEALGVYIENKNEIKVILLDMAMPIMDGEATIRALRKIDPTVKIIGMSGLAENGKYKTMWNIANSFLTKPFTAAKLLKTLARVVAE
jgi:hypothetical protein